MALAGSARLGRLRVGVEESEGQTAFAELTLGS
jgi:hypothetical protein